MSAKCSKCGEKGLESGKLAGGSGGFKPDQVKFWNSFQTVTVSAQMCRNCGHIELVGEVEYRRKSARRPAQTSATGARLVRMSTIR